jgi:GntR family transcriptional repressor for pyruvate dehydrogenase complex
MESLKLVRSSKGGGVYVLASDEEALVHVLAAALVTKSDNIYDIFYVRRIIEPHVAELAADKATSKEIEELETLLLGQAKAVADGESIAKYDIRFHAILAVMSKNLVLVRLLAALSDLLEQTRSEYLQHEERSQKSIVGHSEIFSAVKRRNAPAARRAMCAHLEEMETIVLGKKRNICDSD